MKNKIPEDLILIKRTCEKPVLKLPNFMIIDTYDSKNQMGTFFSTSVTFQMHFFTGTGYPN